MAQTAAPIATTAAPEPTPIWLRLLFPSAGVVVFFIIFGAFVLYSPSRLLNDPDAGWHIRNGQYILATHSIPRTDHFSWSMPGKPWFAWEWLYDVIVGTLANFGGLTLFTVFNAVIISATFGAFLRAMMRRSGDFVMSFVLWSLAAMAASIHFLGRPHVVTMLFLYLLLEMLAAFSRGNSKYLSIGAPPLFLLWANLHGGFVAGLAILAIATFAGWWDKNSRAIRLLFITIASCAVTLLNPYGWHLHQHVLRYLGSDYLMRTIEEFAAPSFRGIQTICFGALILIAVVVLARVPARNTTDLLLILFSIAIGLRAVRNIPLSSIIIGFTLAPYLSEFWRQAAEDRTRGHKLMNRIREFTTSTAAMDLKFSGLALAAIATLAAVALTFSAERSSGGPLPRQRWNEAHLPVNAVEFLVSHDLQQKLFTSDYWGAYLIWRLYPGQVFIDDRHDFYGEAFVRQNLKVLNLQPGWREVLDQHGIMRVLVPGASPVARELISAGGWREIYHDPTSVIVERTPTQESR